MIYRTPFLLPWLYPNLIWRGPSQEKILYLTFDDGPVYGPTEFVMDTLKKYNNKATFFCIGENIAKHPDIFKRIGDEGHSIGNHTFNHLNGWKTPLDKYVVNTLKCHREINRFETSGVYSNYFRPPFGRITRAQIKALSDHKIIMWDVLTNDYNQAISPNDCLKNSIRVTRPGSIVVFHDSIKAEKNMMYALPRYMEHFLLQGFLFNVLSV